MRWLVFIVILPFISWSQDSKFEIGINIGGYKANKYTAVRYDGWDGEYSGTEALYNYDLSVDYYLSLGTSSPYSVYNRIKQSYNDQDFTRHQYPESMRYNLGVLVGLHLGYRMDDMTTFFIDTDFADLRLGDALTFEVDDPSNQTSQPVIKVEQIYGEEKRLISNVGFHFGMGDDPEAHPYVELGGNITAARVVKNSIIVQGNEYTLTQWTQNANSIYSRADYGGVGFGGFLGAGYRMHVKNQIWLDFGATGTYARIAIGPDVVGLERKFKLQGQFYIRAIWS